MTPLEQLSAEMKESMSGTKWSCGKCYMAITKSKGEPIPKHFRTCPFSNDFVDEGECRNCGACDGAGHRCNECEDDLTPSQCEVFGGICDFCSSLLS